MIAQTGIELLFCLLDLPEKLSPLRVLLGALQHLVVTRGIVSRVAGGRGSRLAGL